MSIFIDLEMNTTDTRLVRRKELKNEVIEIGAAAEQPAGTCDGGLKTKRIPKTNIGCGLLLSAREHDQKDPPYQTAANNVNTS